jgi:hypothetical protein
MSEEELSDGALRNIGLMQRMSRTLPEDFFMVAAVQELAQLAHDLKPFLKGDQEATLLGIGALMIREGRDEAIAGIQAALAIQSLRGRPS